MKKVLVVLLVLAMVFSFAACGKKKAGGELVMYTTVADAQLDATIEAFNAKYPDIHVVYTYGKAGECLGKIQAESANPQADVMFGGLQYSDLAQYGEFFEDYVCANDSKMIDGFHNTTGKLTFHDSQIPCLIVNKELEEKAGVTITGWNSLLDPALKDKVAIADPASSSSAWNWMQCVLTDFGGWDSQEAWDYLEKFAANAVILPSSSAPCKDTANGEYVVGLTYEPLVIQNEELCIPKCRVVYWEEGVTSVGFASAIIKGAKNLDNAKLFMDFLESQEGQQVYADAGARPITTEKVTVANPLMVDLSTINYKECDTQALADHKQDIKDRWTDLWAKVHPEG
ncbi:MAG: extracellular solute-binding protein [Firmicutes bacterium]|nr:extracellular solute-binding protein [Bacillota bacterium]MBR0481864.1 extracellular solute-binding protein [Bacillota bacterium]